MKKKLLVFAAAFMLLFSFAGQAMAAFTTNELIRVVYVNGGVGNEVATDLGAASTWTSPSAITSTTSYTTNNFAISSFTGYGYADLNVVYFLKTQNNAFWTSGDLDGQNNSAGKKSASGGSIMTVLGYYASLGGSQVTGVSSNLSSYWKNPNQSGLGVGKFVAFLRESGEQNLAALATVGYVDQYLYYYPSSTSNLAGSGVAVAQIRTFADGHTEIMPVSSVPVPAAVWLLGSGLIGLVGIRRRMTLA